jgi:KRAB domain-containing zinc finger protein
LKLKIFNFFSENRILFFCRRDDVENKSGELSSTTTEQDQDVKNVIANTDETLTESVADVNSFATMYVFLDSIPCDLCTESFSSRGELRTHLSEVHPFKYKCEHCIAAYRTEDLLTEHLKKHENEPLIINKAVEQGQKLHQCDQCGESFSNIKILQRHIKSHPTFKCEECLKVFDLKIQYTRHFITHNKALKPCSFCRKPVPEKNLKKHEKCCKSNANEQETWPCEECDVVLYRLSAFYKHMDEHYYPHVCSICSKRFEKQGKLNTHMRCHTKYECQFCKNILHHKNRMENHMVQHVIPKNCKCKHCQVGQGYVRSRNLKMKVFICDLCSVHFANKLSVKNHIKSVHLTEKKKKFKCNVCKLQFSSISTITKHINDEHYGKLKSVVCKYACSYCEKSFKRPNHLIRHIAVHTGERPNGCDLCEQKFAQRSQLVTHKLMRHKILPYNCPSCGLGFKIQTDMWFHSSTCEKKST